MLHRIAAILATVALLCIPIAVLAVPNPVGSAVQQWASSSGGAGPAAMTFKDVLFFLYGFAGALVGECIKTGHLALPRFYITHTKSGEEHKVFDPGCFAIAIVGGLAAMYFDHRPITALAFGLASSYLGRPFYDKFLARVISGGGFNFSLAPPSDTPRLEGDTALAGQKGGECAPIRAGAA